jgi:fatty-acyl-CoA synthase
MVSRVVEMIPQLKTVRHFICISEDSSRIPNGHLDLQLLIANHTSEVSPIILDPEDLCGVYYTGGTTGRPKGVMLSHRVWINTVLTEMLELGLGYNEVFAYQTPLTHASGCLILPILLRNGTCLILDHFEPELFLKTVEKEQVTATLLVPTMIYVLLDYLDLKKYSLKSLRNVAYGAAAIAPERLKQAINTFGPIFTQFYGQTEAPMMFSVLTKEDHIISDSEREKRIFSSCGRPTFPAQLRIIDDQGRNVKQGEVGEIIVRHINMMSGYLKNPEATATTIKDGWLYTGDLARQDQEGY